MHEEHQPAHLKIANTKVCFEKCQTLYQSPCNKFCPANVYELMVRVPGAAAETSGLENQGAVLPAPENSQFRMQVNFSNCIHCKTCDIMCPFDNITWTTPEGGGGPNFTVQ
jgi:electron-transferring-flavoprotein dehydrogenase